MWSDQSVFYQIYPLGFCDAPQDNDNQLQSRILKMIDWIPHMQKLHMGALYLSPVFESDRHGYDTRDYKTIDCRLGTNDDFAAVCTALHQAGIKVVLDGVFNHVGRGFWAFKDVQARGYDSPYKDWFYIHFDGNSNYNDGFWYEGWEGHFELVKLNLKNPAVVSYLLEAVQFWKDRFDIDGIRLDVAYSLDKDFLRQLRSFCDSLKPDFFLIGETLHGDYNQLVNPQMLHSCTNYECYKGLYSSFNDMNLFEIAHSLNRQFGPEQWTLYKGKNLLTFVDNHDVTRIASILKNKKHLPLAYGLLYGMPGIPCIYYGSEWGAAGEKTPGSDANLRPAFSQPDWQPLTDLIADLSRFRSQSKALSYGSFSNIMINNHQLMFERRFEDEHLIILINCDEAPFTFHLPKDCLTNCLTGETLTNSARTLEGCSFEILQM